MRLSEILKQVTESSITEFAPGTGGDSGDSGDSGHLTDYFSLTQSYSRLSKKLFNSIGSQDPVYGIRKPKDVERSTEIYKNKPAMDKLAELFLHSGVGAGLKYFLTLPEVVQDYLGTAWKDHGLDWEKDCKRFGLL